MLHALQQPAASGGLQYSSVGSLYRLDLEEFNLVLEGVCQDVKIDPAHG